VARCTLDTDLWVAAATASPTTTEDNENVLGNNLAEQVPQECINNRATGDPSEVAHSVDSTQSLAIDLDRQAVTQTQLSQVQTNQSLSDNNTAPTASTSDVANDTNDLSLTTDVGEGQNITAQHTTASPVNLMDLPTVKADDYLQDEEFKYMFQYLNTGTLTGDDECDRLTLLMADQYYIENDALYRLTTPRNKKQSRLYTHNVRLCVPLSYRHEVLKHFHDKFGQTGVQRLFLTLSERLYWKNLYNYLYDDVKTCDTCLRTKRNYSFKSTPLHPLEVPNGPCDFWALDHKIYLGRQETEMLESCASLMPSGVGQLLRE